jgi:hypothetical protein
VATSISGTNITTDDELEDEQQLPVTTSSLHVDNEGELRRESNSSSITNFTINKTSSQFHLSSRASSPLSGITHSSLSPPSSGISRNRLSVPATTININVVEAKGKGGVRNFMRKFFKQSSSTSKSPGNTRPTAISPPAGPGLNIDLVRGTAYPSMSPLPITQGPIRLLVLRHGERLDRYYSSQWLRQAFDKDGNFCRFSPILPYVKKRKYLSHIWQWKC